MSNEAFEKFIFENMRTDSPNFKNERAFAELAWNAAIQHCKQGEPVCYADPENVDMAAHKDMRFRFNVCTKNENQFTQPLFTHANPEIAKTSEGWKPTEDEYLKWCDKYDFPSSYTSSRQAFEDAASLYLSAKPSPL
jgi:hypothetical protein